MDSICGKCNKPIDGEEYPSMIKCSVCLKVFHDKRTECSSVNIDSWLNYSAYNRNRWTCLICRQSSNKSQVTSNGDANLNSTQDMGNPSAGSSTINNPQKEVEEIIGKDEMLRKMSQLLDLKLDIKLKEHLNLSIEPLQTRITNQEEKLNNLVERVDKLEEAEGPCQCEGQCAVINQELESRIQKLEDAVVSSDRRVEEMQNYSRRENVVFTGIPITEDEDPFEVAITAAKIVGVDISYTDIVDCHRLPHAPGDRPPAFIVKFVNRDVKRRVIQKYRAEKPNADRFGGDKRSKVFANEHLAQNTSKLFREAKQLLKLGYKKVTCHGGKVYVQKENATPKILVNNMAQIGELIGASKTSQ